MAKFLTFKENLRKLREHTNPEIFQEQKQLEHHLTVKEDVVRQTLDRWKMSMPPIPAHISAAFKCQIIAHRRVRTTTCRVVERAVREVIANHSLAAVVMRVLFEKLCKVFIYVKERQPYLISTDVDLTKLEDLALHGNQRQHFHAIRGVLGAFRALLRFLSTSDMDPNNSLLQELGKLGMIVPNEVHTVVATAAFSDTDEILSPPEHLRRIWKPVGKERIAPEDGGKPGQFTKQLWRTTCRVRDCRMPEITEFELKAVFGNSATLASHAGECLPYECGANKYTLAGLEPFVVDCTEQGLFTTSGPSGTAYRYLNLWIVLGGSRAKLPEVRFALAALLLGGAHHSLIEVMSVCAPIADQEAPRSLEEMLDQLVPRAMEMEWRGESHKVMPETFYGELSNRLAKLTA